MFLNKVENYLPNKPLIRNFILMSRSIIMSSRGRGVGVVKMLTLDDMGEGGESRKVPNWMT